MSAHHDKFINPGRTLKDLERLRQAIAAEKFASGDGIDPLNYGLARAEFERSKLTRLIAAAEGVESLTARAKVLQWKRQLKRMEASSVRFAKLRRSPQQTELIRRMAMP